MKTIPSRGISAPWLAAIAAVGVLGGAWGIATADGATMRVGSQPSSLIGQRTYFAGLQVVRTGATCPARARVRVWSQTVAATTKRLNVTTRATACTVSGSILLPVSARSVNAVTARVTGVGLQTRTVKVKRPTTGAVNIRLVDVADRGSAQFCPADGRTAVLPIGSSKTAQGTCATDVNGVARLRQVKPGSWTLTTLGGVGGGPCYNVVPSEGFATCTRVPVKAGFITIVDWDVPSWG